LSDLEREEVRSQVMQIRKQLPRLGTRKLYHQLSGKLADKHIKLGRDRLFEFLREENMLIPKVKKYHKTTNSRHWMHKYPNVIKGLKIDRPEQLWVADITYLQMQDKHYYLHLITDAYSKKIVGYELCNNLKTASTLKALRMALNNRQYRKSLIHHSDRGLQYCSKEYTDLLKTNKVTISMTEKYDPYENAVAERVNGILKEEFGLDISFESEELMHQYVDQSITLYNQLRPHMSIGLLTPTQAHNQTKVKLKTYKKKPQEVVSTPEVFVKFVCPKTVNLF